MNEEQIKARLIAIAKEQNKTFNDLLKPLAFERLLARVSVSTHRNKLIFKGGLCLKQLIDGGRETTDIDFLIKKVEDEQVPSKKSLRIYYRSILMTHLSFLLLTVSSLKFKTKSILDIG